MTKHILLITTVLVIFGCGGANEQTPYEVVKASNGNINFSPELDYVSAQAKQIGQQFPAQMVFATDLATECESMRKLFTEVFQTPSSVSIDFLLQIHEDSLTGQKVIGADPVRSRELILIILQKNKYDIALIEGSTLNGFTPEVTAEEVYARLKYDTASPITEVLRSRGVDPTSPMFAIPAIRQLVESRPDTPDKVWREIEVKTGGTFWAGESLQLTTLMGKLVGGQISSSETKHFIDVVQKLRSAYVVARALKDLKNIDRKRAAVIFGFTHENDFRAISSVLHIDAKIYNTTGVKRSKFRE